MPGAPGREEGGGRQQRPHRYGAMERRGEIERDEAEHRGGDRGRQHQRAPGQHPGGKAGTQRDPDREQRIVDVEDEGVAAETKFDDRRQQRVDDHRHGPEQAGDDRAAPQSPVGAQRAEQEPCRGYDISLDLQGRRRLSGRGDEARRDVGDRGEHDAQPRGPAHVMGRARRQRCRGRPEDRGDEGRALDQRVAAGQLRLGEVIGQDAVLDRAEQSRQHAEHRQRDEEQGHGADDETGGRDCHGAELDELQPLRHLGLVVAVGPLTAERGQQERRRRQQDRSDEGERVGRLRRQLGDHDEGQGRLEVSVVEGGEELAPEQRRELAASKKVGAHEVLVDDCF